MSAEAAFAVRSWSVASRTCTMTLQRPKPGAVVHCSIESSPTEPTRLSTAEWAEYRAGRNHALAGIAHELGITAAVLEV